MRTRLEVFQRLDSRFRGNDKQGGNDEGDAFPWSPYPKPGLKMEQNIKESERICRKLTVLRHQSGRRLFYGLQ